MAGVTRPSGLGTGLDSLIGLLREAGFVAAEEEARELSARAGGDLELLDGLIRRRLTGEPLAWITGRASFCGIEVLVAPGVYVPRWQSEPLARRAVERLPATGTAIDLCTGSGAIAKVLSMERPEALVVATDLDQLAVSCATANGVAVSRGNLFDPLPASLEGSVDVVVSVVPYVPTPDLAFLPHDTLAFESSLSYDGGPDGMALLRRVVAGARRFLWPGGALMLELGGEQASQLAPDLAHHDYVDVVVLFDEDGDARGIEATAGSSG
jgi:release factor glutamine methyltransferase